MHYIRTQSLALCRDIAAQLWLPLEKHVNTKNSPKISPNRCARFALFLQIFIIWAFYILMVYLGFHEISWDPLRSLEISWDPLRSLLRSPEISWDTLRSLGTNISLLPLTIFYFPLLCFLNVEFISQLIIID